MANTELTEVTIQYVNPPKPGKKYGSIKTAEKGYIFCQPELLKEFNTGEVRKIEITANPPRNQGEEPFKHVTRIMPRSDSARPAPQNVRPGMSPEDALQARVSMCLSEAMGAGKIPIERNAICKALEEIETGCRMHGAPGRQRRDDMRDEIPEGNWQVKSENPADGFDDKIPF